MKNKIQTHYDAMKEIKVPDLEEWVLEFGKPREPIAHINMLDEIREPVEPKAVRMVLDLILNRKVGDSHE